jgi:hypothetical protein
MTLLPVSRTEKTTIEVAQRIALTRLSSEQIAAYSWIVRETVDDSFLPIVTNRARRPHPLLTLSISKRASVRVRRVKRPCQPSM